jgi:type I restriction enzyme, R subunit
MEVFYSMTLPGQLVTKIHCCQCDYRQQRHFRQALVPRWSPLQVSTRRQFQTAAANPIKMTAKRSSGFARPRGLAISMARFRLAAFKTYYTTAELSAITDPNLVFNLRAKLDAEGHYDDFEVDRVVAVELKPDAKQGELIAALEPVVDRLMRKYKAAQEALKIATEKKIEADIKAAQDELNALILFKTDLGAFIRLYTFLSQIFDYGNTAIEKRAIFYKRLLPLLEFGREREGIDLSKVVLTHHHLKTHGRTPMVLNAGETPKLDLITEAGSGSVQEKEKALLDEIIRKVNGLFEGELTDQDKLVYVNNVIKGKLLESEKLRQQATNNTKEQFANSPDLSKALLNAIMDALDAHSLMSTQALNSPTVREGMKDILSNHAGLYETLRERAGG